MLTTHPAQLDNLFICEACNAKESLILIEVPGGTRKTIIEGRLDGMQTRLDDLTGRMGDLNGYVGDLPALKTSSSSSLTGRNARKRCLVGHRASCSLT